MNEHIQRIQQTIEPLRQQIINHPVYAAVQNVDDLQLFMHYHVYAVWDFMSLLKALQNKLTCTTVPWYPVGSAETRYLINEIVTGEESDVDQEGMRKSHFELYLEAMHQCGATTEAIETFLENLQRNGSFSEAFDAAATPQAVREFVTFTFNIIQSEKAYLQAAIFTFGREDLIPDMFLSIVNDLHRNFPESVSIFKYYLERHIEVDGGHHSQLALQMTENLCGTNETYWQEAEAAIVASLQKRIDLWDGVYRELSVVSQ
ncbi:DUF3050 domain-containing protein [Arundinibacter roseus]|uniref:DUF3050 domain-containing protein n=1 Tax=Arundinibacter roseus TaxID=2070510 RepID=A0A4V2X8A7_9BACT|nr:DUF3050 domain-containing protein [Arundinibacter roseus]TDB59145.1 DUF3050 domain-containing protein [Arundinibacter roseus]